MTRYYLIQDYAGGMRQRYAGKNRGEAARRIKFSTGCGWPAAGFVIVQARSLAEAFDKAEPILLARKAEGKL
jgi:hypothetical protein